VSSWSDFLVDAKAAIVQTAQALGDEHPSARVVSVRPVFKGRTALKQAIPHEISEIDRFTDSVNRVEVLVNRSFDQTAPVLDLEALASRPGAPGELARLILALEGRALPPGAAAPDVEALVHRARRAAGMTTDGDDTAVRQMVRDTSMDLLDRLIA